MQREMESEQTVTEPSSTRFRLKDWLMDSLVLQAARLAVKEIMHQMIEQQNAISVLREPQVIHRPPAVHCVHQEPLLIQQEWLAFLAEMELIPHQ